MKTVVITGVSRGIGRALAEEFLRLGHEVIGTSTTGKNSLTDGHLTMLKLDLSRPESIVRCAGEIIGMEKPIDILINNAGALFDEEESGVVIEKLRQTLEVNLIGTVDFTERLLASIAHGGHIVNVSSSAGSFGRRATSWEYPSYKISKAALNMYTKTLALRLAPEITVSSVHPGWVKTDMGGDDADITPEEAAKDIVTLALKKVESGKFWFQGKEFDW